MTSQNNTHTITKEEEGQRLDHILASRLQGKTRNYIHYLFKEGMITSKKKKLKKSNSFKEGDVGVIL